MAAAKKRTTQQKSTQQRAPQQKSTRSNNSKRKYTKRRGPEINEFWSIPMFGFGLLLLAMLFIEGESVWNGIRVALRGVFGIGMYPLAIVLLYLAFLVAMAQPVIKKIWTVLGSVTLLCAMPVAFSKLDVTALNWWEMQLQLYHSGSTGVWQGGFVGGLLGGTLLKMCGRPAVNILLVILVLIALMIVFTITPADVVHFLQGSYANWQLAHAKAPTAERNYSDYEQTEMEEDSWKYRHDAASVRRAQAMTEAEARSRARAAERAAARERAQRPNVDIALGPDPIKRKAAQSVSPETTFPATPGAVPAAAATAMPVAAQPVPGQPVATSNGLGTLPLGPGGTFGMNPLQAKAAAVPPVPVPKPDVQAIAEEAFDITVVPGMYGQAGETASDVESLLYPTQAKPVQPTVQAQPVQAAQPMQSAVPVPSTIHETPAVAVQPVAPTLPMTSAPVAARPTIVADQTLAALPEDRELDKLIQKAVDAPAEAEAAAAKLPDAPDMTVESYRYPPLSLFEITPEANDEKASEEMKRNADTLVNTLDSFGVKTRILDVCRGPSVTRYELQPAAGVKISRITSLADDIAMNLAAAGVRIEAPIPGKAAVGIEVPNRIKSIVGIRSLLESQNYTKAASPLTMALGRDIAGIAQVADLCKMPHLLIAGSTGSGKSVCVNSIIISFLYKAGPEDVKLILIDPKVVELAEYNGIPHLLMPVVTEPKKAAGALGSAVAEMERRYRAFAENNVRDIKSYNRLAMETEGLDKMPYIAIIIDELADLMMVSGKEVEDYICRIAQKARAAGMHLIVATQRPSVDVITGLIKANIPSRVAFAVSSQVDSRTILDGSGAEKLLGSGDMLFMPVGASKPTRIQGAWVKDAEISAVLDFVKQSGETRYNEEMIAETDRIAAQSQSAKGGSGGGGDDEDGGETHDPMFETAVMAVIDAGMASTSLLQRRCKLGYARAARIMDEMEQAGVIGPYEGAKPRKVLITRQQWQEHKLAADGGSSNADDAAPF